MSDDVKVEYKIPSPDDPIFNDPLIQKGYDSTKLLFMTLAVLASPNMAISMMLSAIVQEMRTLKGNEETKNILNAYADGIETIQAMEDSDKEKKH